MITKENTTYLKTREELRSWLLENAATQSFLNVPISVKSKENTIVYIDIVEECLCFGWIDGVKKKIDEETLVQRITPRKKNSNWTELNKERVRRLEKLGLMTDMGRSVLPDMEKKFVVHSSILERLQKDELAYQNFLAMPELYRRIRVDTIQGYDGTKDKELFRKRLEKFIENTRNNKMYGDWNDKGRLS